MNGDNFTDRVRKVLQIAREEATRLHHEYVGTEHLFLGVIREEKGVGAQALRRAGITLEIARAEVIRILSQDDQFGGRQQEDPDEVDQRFKTAVALVELHRQRFGAYPDSLDDLKFVGASDRRTLVRGLRYEKLPDGYALDVVVQKVRFRYPPDFWRGLGIRRTNVDRSSGA